MLERGLGCRIGWIGGDAYALEVLVECHRAMMDENEAADAEDDKIAHTSRDYHIRQSREHRRPRAHCQAPLGRARRAGQDRRLHQERPRGDTDEDDVDEANAPS